ncbi:MAG TPA: response regulator [Thermoanaerobaculia bacterium]|nr:response regulator [Thermoanaerobaculia bacterium]
MSLQTSRYALIVDDDESIRGLIRTLLQLEKFEVDEASSGNEAIGRLRMRHYDVIVLDLMMALGSGFDVLEASEAERPGEKFVIVVSATSQAAIDKIEGAQIVAKIRKPFDIEELLSAVRQCTQHR